MREEGAIDTGGTICGGSVKGYLVCDCGEL